MSENHQSFDVYWQQLVQRVHDGEVLTGPERDFYDLSTIRGEIYSGGLSGYFSERYADFERHVSTLESHGFGDVAQALRDARNLLFGESPLNEETVDAGIERYLDLPDDDPDYEEIESILADLYPRCDDIEDYRNDLGLRERFYNRVD